MKTQWTKTDVLVLVHFLLVQWNVAEQIDNKLQECSQLVVVEIGKSKTQGLHLERGLLVASSHGRRERDRMMDSLTDGKPRRATPGIKSLTF